jgi:UrcA family protein
MGITNLKIAIALTATVFGTGVLAGEDSLNTETRSEAVRYSRSDLSAPQGAEQLYARLDSAARAVCGAPSRVLSETVQWQQCRARALGSAVADVNDARLSALYRGTLPRRLVAQTQAPEEEKAGS